MVTALSRGWAHNWGESVLPFDSSITTPGGPIAATVTSSGFTGVALVDPESGAIQTRVETFPNPGPEQAGGAFDGRYVVWKDMTVAGDPDHWVIKVWDARGGQTRVVGANPVDSHGNPISSSWQNPVASDGYAAWQSGTDNNGGGEIHLLRLATGVDHIVRRGHPGWLALSAGKLIWAESPKPGVLTRIRSIDTRTGREVAPPLPLASAVGAWGFATNGSAWVWVSGNTPTAYVGFDQSTKAIKIGVVPQGGASPPLAISGAAAEVPVSAGGAMLINLQTLAWSFEPSISSAVATGNDFLVSHENSGGKTGQATGGLATLTASLLLALKCR
ncbi:MAG: hypothetical protein NVSMB48_01830 [Marmoricola sp.]